MADKSVGDRVVRYIVIASLVTPGLWAAKGLPAAYLIAKRMRHI